MASEIMSDIQNIERPRRHSLPSSLLGPPGAHRPMPQIPEVSLGTSIGSARKQPIGQKAQQQQQQPLSVPTSLEQIELAVDLKKMLPHSPCEREAKKRIVSYRSISSTMFNDFSFLLPRSCRTPSISVPLPWVIVPQTSKDSR